MNPTPNPVEPVREQSSPESSAGPTIGMIIILAVIVIGGIYFWAQRGETPSTAGGTWEETLDASADLEAAGTQDDSDETSSIEADLDATDIDSIDADLDTV